MTPERSRLLAKSLFAVFAVFLLAEIGLLVAARTGPRPPSSSLLGDLGFTITFALFPAVGLILALRRPENTLGWLMLGMGVILAIPTEAYGVLAYSRGWAGAEWAIASTQWTWVPEIGIAGTFVLLLFPDGHLPSPRWRWVAWTVGIGIVVSSLAVLFGPGSLADNGYPELRNPFGIEALKPFLAVAVISIATIPLGIIAAAVSLVVRYRRGDPTERLQIRWLAAAAITVATLYAAAMIATTTQNASWAGGGEGWISVLQNLAVVSFA
ncbi:MAG: hypothetical protein ACJ758_10660, partial [Actinomycetota bacterium]